MVKYTQLIRVLEVHPDTLHESSVYAVRLHATDDEAWEIGKQVWLGWMRQHPCRPSKLSVGRRVSMDD